MIALEEVFGMTNPAAAMIGTTIMLVRLPGRPPMQCLSATLGASQCNLSPALIIAAVSATVSARSRRSPAQAVTKAAR